jgi:CheY-like chemotaxis protein
MRMDSIRSILLAEDNQMDVELTLEALGQHIFANDVVVVGDGAEALDYLRRNGKYADRQEGNPAVILLDLKMPKVDGLKVLKEIKGDVSLRTIPVVVLTSSREETDLVKSYQLGVNAYVVKPVDFHDFVEAVSKLGVFWAIVNEPPPARVNAG